MNAPPVVRTAPVGVLAVAVMVWPLTGCGGGTRVTAAPAAVPAVLAPATIGAELGLAEYSPARHTFAVAGKDSLVADGRVWQIRRGATLVGTLQIATVKPTVHITRRKDRNAILSGVMTGSTFDVINVDDVSVATTTAGDKNVYVWFGRDLFEVMQLKGTQLDPDAVLHDVIHFQQSSGLLLTASSAPRAGGA